MKMEPDNCLITRRALLRLGMMSCVGFGVGGLKLPFRSSSARLLNSLSNATVEERVALVQRLYEKVAFHKSGIMYSMLHLDSDGVRPFQEQDFIDSLGLDATVGRLQISGPAEYLECENSISASGLYLAAQTYRFQSTRSRSALREAARAFHSLELIFQMGVDAGKRGWMGKPYGFRPSNQTSGDQYQDALHGLMAYHGIASSDERARIEAMIVSFADYWRSVDYVLSYFGSHWDQKGETDAYNAIYAAINAAAYGFTKSSVYRAEFESWMSRETWTRQTLMSERIQQIRDEAQRTGVAPIVIGGWQKEVAGDQLKPGEFLPWETNIHSKFVAVSTDVIERSIPGALEGKAGQVLNLWWKQWRYGIGDDLCPYYWYAVNAIDDTWRPLSKTTPLPKERWPFGDPLMSYISQVRWMEPLARFLITSVLAAQYSPEVASEAKALANRIMGTIDSVRLHWMYDPDGEQLLPAVRYYGECFSSEMPGSFLSAYWRGKRDGFW